MRLAGIDYDTFGVYIVTVPLTGAILPETIGWEAIELRPRTTTKGRMMASTFEAAARTAEKLAEAVLIHGGVGETGPHEPLAVAYIEHGYGASRRNDFEMGRVQGAVASYLTGIGVPVNEVNAGTWKKDVIGKGNAKKPEIVEHLAGRGFHFPRQDLYDAFGIAVYGRLQNDRILDLRDVTWTPAGGANWKPTVIG